MWNLEDSDDEDVFLGEISLKEVKRALITSKQRQTMFTTCTKTAEDENNRSIKIIETHSTPNIRISVCNSPNTEISNLKCSSDSCFSGSITPACDNQDTENTYCTMSDISANELESLSYQNVTNDLLLSDLGAHKPDVEYRFQQIEKLVHDLSVTPDKITDKNNEELDNTLDVVNYILNSEHNDSDKKQAETKSNTEGLSQLQSENAVKTSMLKLQPIFKTPIKTERSVNTLKSSESKLRPPSTKTSLFKTPGNSVSQKRMLTPLKKQFEHVASPVASYINDSPVVPLLKNVKPKKPLHGTSFIPQPIKNPSKINAFNKENQNLPSTAYRCAKETKVIALPDEHKLPPSQWAKHLASSQKKGVVMKHIHRENNSTTNKPLFQQQEDSFSNLTLHQADLSVCTQKSAVKKAL